MLIFKRFSNLKSLLKLIMYVGLVCHASYSGFWLRFDGDIPDWAMNTFLRTLPVLVLVHHCRLIHGSGPNTSETPRLAFAVHLQDTGNRYRLYRNDKGIPWHIFLDDLAPKREDGFPDYTDPSVFPALWQQPLGCEEIEADRP